MKIQLIRNATIVVEYAGKKFLVDPMLSDKGTYPAFTPGSTTRNPLHSLPMPVEEILKDVDAVIVTHLHVDHWDDAAKESIPKDIKIFAQNETDSGKIQEDGFKNVESLQENTSFEGIQLIKTEGNHGRSKEVLAFTGLVSGVVFKHDTEKTLYVAGDSVWYEGVQNAVEAYKPEVIVVNGGANGGGEIGSIVMDKEDIYEVHKAAPNTAIISVHMEAVDHGQLTREELKRFANEKGFSSKILVPADGESYTF